MFRPVPDSVKKRSSLEHVNRGFCNNTRTDTTRTNGIFLFAGLLRVVRAMKQWFTIYIVNELYIIRETLGRDTRCDKSLRHVAATGCCSKSPRVSCENHCCCDRILSPRSVARIQTGLNSCDITQRQNKRKQPCRSVCAHLGQVAATKLKSINERASINFSSC